jgi:hypothetical protein
METSKNDNPNLTLKNNSESTLYNCLIIGLASSMIPRDRPMKVANPSSIFITARNRNKINKTSLY